ncbi:MAG: PAS domain S-box protein, partial [Planctomycetes bacterium]|nr:PAS domain S-box protein [Planctomycetota bacterium]
EPLIVEPSEETCRRCPLEALNGRRWTACLPLRRKDEAFGLLAVCLEEPLQFDEEEIGLLKELAGDLSLAVQNIDIRRKHAEAVEELRENRAWLSTVLTSIADGVIAVDLEGKVTFLNHPAREMTGWDEQAHGRPLEEIFHIVNALTGEPAENPVRRVLREGVVVGLANHTMLISRDGTRRQIADSAAPIRKDDGSVSGVVLVFRDVTEEYNRRQALRESEQRFRLLYEQAPLGYQSLDEAGQVLAVNHAWIETTGLAEEDAIGRNFAELLAPQDRGRFQEAFEELKRAGELHGAEFRLVRPDDAEVIVAFDGRAARDAAGEFRGAHCILADVTARRHAEQAIRAARARLESILRAAPTGIGLVRDRVLLEVNDRVCEITGYGRQELLGRSTRMLYPSEREFEQVGRAYEPLSRGGVGAVETRWVRKDGTVIDVLLNAAGIDPSDPSAGVTFTVMDITDRKQAEQQRRHLEEQLRTAQKMEAVGRLAGGVAHDFRNQLTVITGYAELLLRDNPPGSATGDAVSEILEAAHRATTTTSQLLTLGRRQTLRPQVIDVNEVLRSLEGSLGRMLGEAVRLSSAAEATLPVLVDRALLEQALVNLAVNARDAMPTGGELRFEAGDVTLDSSSAATKALPPGRYVRIAVTDTGVGMDERTLRRAFEPFFTTKGVGEGTGLGLSMVYGFVQQSGGAIEVESQPGEGTTFVIHLPAASGRVSPASPEEVPTGRGRLPRGEETILVVEDEEALRQLIVRILRSCGYTVMEAGSAREALPLGEHFDGPIDLLLTDVVMPGMSGPELAGRLQAVRPEMAVLFVSGYVDKSVPHGQAVQAGLNALSKPFSPLDLARAVRNALDRRGGDGPKETL